MGWCRLLQHDWCGMPLVSRHAAAKATALLSWADVAFRCLHMLSRRPSLMFGLVATPPNLAPSTAPLTLLQTRGACLSLS